MRALTRFFHHLFNPHCEECREREIEDSVCKSCETLRFQLETSIAEKKMLIDALTNRTSVETTIVQPEPLKPRTVPWRVKQQILENESRQAASILKKKLDELNPNRPHVTAPVVGSISTEDLEKELDLVEEERMKQ